MQLSSSAKPRQNSLCGLTEVQGQVQRFGILLKEFHGRTYCVAQHKHKTTAGLGRNARVWQNILCGLAEVQGQVQGFSILLVELHAMH